jgi:hypothetical protein
VPDSDEMGSAQLAEIQTQVLNLDVASELTVLVEIGRATMGETLRVEFLKRYIELTKVALETFKKHGGELPGATTLVADFFLKLGAWQTFTSNTVRPSWAEISGGDFPGQLRDTAVLTTWCQGVVARLQVVRVPRLIVPVQLIIHHGRRSTNSEIVDC